MSKSKALELHEHVPPNWYFESLKVDPLQRLWHRTRFNQLKKLAKPAKKILDVGSADGVFSKVILDATGAEKLIGIDVVKTSVDWANKHWKHNSRMKFLVGDAHKLKFENNSFDAVFCMEVLEHVEDPIKVLSEFRRVMKKDGYGIFMVPSDNDLFKIIWWLWLHFYPRGWVWRDTHIQTYRGNFLPMICKKAGFKVEVAKTFNFGMLSIVRVRKV